jgi:hypothetical protein
LYRGRLPSVGGWSAREDLLARMPSFFVERSGAVDARPPPVHAGSAGGVALGEEAPNFVVQRPWYATLSGECSPGLLKDAGVLYPRLHGHFPDLFSSMHNAANMDGLTSSTVGFSGIVIERYDFHTPDFSFLIGLVHDFSDASGNIKRLGCFRVRML